MVHSFLPDELDFQINQEETKFNQNLRIVGILITQCGFVLRVVGTEHKRIFPLQSEFPCT